MYLTYNVYLDLALEMDEASQLPHPDVLEGISTARLGAWAVTGRLPKRQTTWCLWSAELARGGNENMEWSDFEQGGKFGPSET